MMLPTFTPMNSNDRRTLAGLNLISALVFSTQAAVSGETFHFHHENILGTSLDLEIAAADEKQAAAAENAVLDEIERIRKILSCHDPASEISRLNNATTPLSCSQELIDVLSGYDLWQAKSQGAYSGHLGELISLWSEAEKTETLPDEMNLKRILAGLAKPGWKIEVATRTVTRLSDPQTLNVNSLGKGYIATKAAEAARKAVPGLTGLLVNIGGDIFASGRSSSGPAWEIGIASPTRSGENAPPVSKVRLTDRAVSTSASYERGFTIAGKRYSHILDPRTGQPADGAASATVVAANNSIANALATILCVLKPEEGLELINSIPGAECLLITADGRQLRSGKFEVYEVPALPEARSQVTSSPSGGWPAGFQVSIAVELKLPPAGGRRAKRPFVAVWVEDSAGKRVRTITVWGRERKYLPELRAWWREAKNNQPQAASVTRATRNAGKYNVEWDGKDDSGTMLPSGNYVIVLESNREHGAYSIQRGRIVCGESAADGVIPESKETGESRITYGPSAP